jgi:hypothetical protein
MRIVRFAPHLLRGHISGGSQNHADMGLRGGDAVHGFGLRMRTAQLGQAEIWMRDYIAEPAGISNLC